MKDVRNVKSVIIPQPKIEAMDIADIIIDKSATEMKVEKRFGLHHVGILGNIGGAAEEDIHDIDNHILTTLEEDRLTRSYFEFKNQHYMGILDEVRREAEEAYNLDSEINRIQEQSYTDIVSLVEKLLEIGVPIPEFGWAEDGSLSLTWGQKKGMASMGVYGDNLAIYSAYFSEEMQSSGVCELSNVQMLSGFATTLKSIISK